MCTSEARNSVNVCSTSNMLGFCASSPVGRISASTQKVDVPRMCARTPGDTAAAPSKYAQWIDSSRLNKAPMITLNAFPNEEYNNVSVALTTLQADQAAAAQISVTKGHCPTDSGQADSSKWESHYSKETVNSAPFVFVNGSASDPLSCAVGVTMTQVPLQVEVPQNILDMPVGASAQVDALTMGNSFAPDIMLNQVGDNVQFAMTQVPLNPAAAEYILKKYQA